MDTKWTETDLTCPTCKFGAKFRYVFKKAEYLNGRRWEEIQKSAEIVLCHNCGASIYISSVKTKAEMK